MLEQNRLTIAISIGVVTAATVGITGYYWYKRRIENTIPIRWRRVGELSNLICYPIKSCGPIRINEIECSKIGLANGLLRDRIFVVVKTNGNFVTGRQYPKMVLIQPEINGSIMKLSAPGMIDTEVNMETVDKFKPLKCTVWDQKINGLDVGDDIAKWFSRYLLSEDVGLRLVFYPKDHSTRDVRINHRMFKFMRSEDIGAFHDATSYMMMNESSLTDLNSRLENPTTLLNFRPNFVVKGPLEYEEDNWNWVRIGDSMIFKNVKPCTRCTFVNINPETAKRSTDGNPLKTLKLFRKLPQTGDNAVMGIHLGVRTAGKITLGDSVYVECN